MPIHPRHANFGDLRFGRKLFDYTGKFVTGNRGSSRLAVRGLVGWIPGRGIASLWGVQFSPLGGDGDQPFERSGPPDFGGRPRRLIGAVDD